MIDKIYKWLFFGMGVLATAFWFYILADFILTIVYGWEGRDLAFGLYLLLLFPAVPFGFFALGKYINHLEGLR